MAASLAGCCAPQYQQCRPAPVEKILREKITKFDKVVKHDLVPQFKVAGVQYPPKKIALLVFKAEQNMELWAQDDTEQWRYIRVFPILGASGGPGPKLREGDRQVPEGVYNISALNPLSHFDVSMRIDYPNLFDREQAKLDGRDQLGGDIYIHGGHFSIGCLAIGNHYAEELFDLTYHVGTQNALVLIAPNDMRRAPPLERKIRPTWV
ncbi:MAG: L,D-transpeptidase family protein, partial [Pseudomonadota bacterium]|nr:L,D-transpeptidase family protein [Pseudomonadota bacterium]